MDVVQIENENVETMDFEEIYQTFKKQAQAQVTESAFLDSDATETGKIQIEISEITEGLLESKKKATRKIFLWFQHGRFPERFVWMVKIGENSSF